MGKTCNLKYDWCWHAICSCENSECCVQYQWNVVPCSKSLWKLDCFDLIAYKSRFWATLTHWGRVTHICVGNLTIIGSDNGLSPDRRQAIIWTNAGIMLIRNLGTNFREILREIHTLLFKNMHLKMSSVVWWQFCLGLNVLMQLLHGYGTEILWSLLALWQE